MLLHAAAFDFICSGARFVRCWVVLFILKVAMASLDDAPPPMECRICRQPGDEETPLFRCARANCRICSPFYSDLINAQILFEIFRYRPCRCDGSIRFVHEMCLEQWMSRKRTTHCEVCMYPIQFEQVVRGNTGLRALRKSTFI